MRRLRAPSAILLFLSVCAHAQAPMAATYVDGARVQEGPTNFCGTDTSTTVNVMVCANSQPIRAYQQGTIYSVKTARANTGPVTLAIDNAGPVAIRKQH